MNWLLICVIAVLVICALEGYFRGFVKIIFSLFAMIITLAVVAVASPKITTYIEENTDETDLTYRFAPRLPFLHQHESARGGDTARGA